VVVKSYIEKSLRQIDRLYTQASSVQKTLFFSKLATLELCGWIEISMDGIVRSLAMRLLKDSQNRRFFEKQVMKKVHGFDYQLHFRHMLINLIGLHGVESMESKVDPVLFQPMRAALNTLKPYRDKHAHEYIKGTTLQLDAPSITLQRFQAVYAGLVHIEAVLKQLK
jgi:hypothetical protein